MAPKKKGSAALTIRPSKNGAVALTDAPSWMKQGGKGKDKFRPQDNKIPFLSLGQKNTPLVEQKKIKLGDWFNTLSGESYGPNPRIICVDYAFRRAKWKPMADGGGKECHSLDGITAAEKKGKDSKGKPTDVCASCIYKDWNEATKKPPLCTDQGAYLVLVEGKEEPMVLILQKTGFKAHKSLASMIRLSEVDIYGNVYMLGSVEQEKKGMGKYLAPTASGGGYVKDQKDYARAERLNTAYSAGFRGGMGSDQTPQETA